ncbi:hypothetical protein K466DRAFT_86103 [Polyporus arcularius HHB13444]|uniref:Uncharacterized protein n=1 Tax=Polyporus arcularius HHB13444 TaxID=1314778 RepID=A0A5C3PGY5_9APHY|nr:hypothetical protein K466DRAFT_86103 [Polyporus arcularius HHB13444]
MRADKLDADMSQCAAERTGGQEAFGAVPTASAAAGPVRSHAYVMTDSSVSSVERVSAKNPGVQYRSRDALAWSPATSDVVLYVCRSASVRSCAGHTSQGFQISVAWMLEKSPHGRSGNNRQSSTNTAAHRLSLADLSSRRSGCLIVANRRKRLCAAFSP